MRLIIYSFSGKQPEWVHSGYDDYARRLPPEYDLQLRELKPEQRKPSSNVSQILAAEAQRVRAALPTHIRTVALDERGTDLTTEAFARRLQAWRDSGDDVAFLIGSADGLDPNLKSQAHERIKLSSLTLPHGLVRVVLAEQIYRAWAILNQHPYHRV